MHIRTQQYTYIERERQTERGGGEREGEKVRLSTASRAGGGCGHGLARKYICKHIY